MDIMNMTIAQLIEKAEERRNELASEITLFEMSEAEASETFRLATDVYDAKPNVITEGFVTKAEDAYYEKSNHLYELRWEDSQLTNLIRSFGYLKNCERIYQVADMLGM